jgi:hypothetical protein
MAWPGGRASHGRFFSARVKAPVGRRMDRDGRFGEAAVITVDGWSHTMSGSTTGLRNVAGAMATGLPAGGKPVDLFGVARSGHGRAL